MDRYEVSFDERFAVEGMHDAVKSVFRNFGSYSVADGKHIWTPPNDRVADDMVEIIGGDLRFRGISVRNLDQVA